MPADPVDVVVGAFRAEGMTGDPEQIRRFARAAVETIIEDVAEWLRTTTANPHDPWGVYRKFLAEFDARGEAVGVRERDTVNLEKALREVRSWCVSGANAREPRNVLGQVVRVVDRALAEIGERDG